MGSPSVYFSNNPYKSAFDPAYCAASIWYSVGVGGDFKQCARPGMFKIGKHRWCKQHAKEFPTDEQPEELRAKKKPGAKWWPGQTVYRAINKYECKLMTGVVKTVRKNGLELEEFCQASDFKAVVPFDLVFLTEKEAWEAAARILRERAEAQRLDMERTLKDAAHAEKTARKA